LNDCHRASKTGVSKKPSEWLRNEQTKDLIAEISQRNNFLFGREQLFSENYVKPINAVRGGSNPGTYVIKEIVYAYAMWISPDFNLKVINAFDDLEVDKNNEITIEYKDMKNQNMISFDFNNMDVRIIDKDNNPWFVLNDVCKILELENPRNITARLDEDEKDAVHIVDTIGRSQEMTIINESGLYSLILRSRKPEAKRFKKWVTSEVLPSIRKTGGYMVSIPNETPEQILSRALLLAKDTMDRQTQEIAELKPKADGYDLIATSEGSMNITNTAKHLQIRPTDLFNYLSSNKWIYRRVIRW